ncbi:MAG: ATP-binding protein [bacterium]
MLESLVAEQAPLTFARMYAGRAVTARAIGYDAGRRHLRVALENPHALGAPGDYLCYSTFARHESFSMDGYLLGFESHEARLSLPALCAATDQRAQDRLALDLDSTLSVVIEGRTLPIFDVSPRGFSYFERELRPEHEVGKILDVDLDFGDGCIGHERVAVRHHRAQPWGGFTVGVTFLEGGAARPVADARLTIEEDYPGTDLAPREAIRPYAADRVEFRAGSRKLVGLWTEVEHPGPASVVVIPPAWAKTKESTSLLAQVLAASFDANLRHLAVLRLDYSNALGESDKDPEFREPGKETLGLTFSACVEDVRAAVDFAHHKLATPPRATALVGMSFSGPLCLRAAVEELRVTTLVELMGASDIQDLVRMASGGIDYVAKHRAGIHGDVQNVLGLLADTDRWSADGIRHRLVFLQDAQADAAKLTVPILWVHGVYDAFVNVNRIRSILDCAPTVERKLVTVPCGHIPTKSTEAVISFVPVIRHLLAAVDVLDPVIAVPTREQAERVTAAEWAAAPRSQLASPRDYWRGYMLGEEGGSLGFDVLAATREYRELMQRQVELLAIGDDDWVHDVGGGMGHSIPFLARLPRRPRGVIAYDLVPQVLEQAARRAAALGVPFTAEEWDAACEPPPASLHAARAVLMSLFLSCLPDALGFLRRLHAVLPEGACVVASSIRPDADLSGVYTRFIEDIAAGVVAPPEGTTAGALARRARIHELGGLAAAPGRRGHVPLLRGGRASPALRRGGLRGGTSRAHVRHAAAGRAGGGETGRMKRSRATADPEIRAAWDEEVRETLRRGVRLFSLVAIVIFLLFWAVDWVVYPPSQFPGVVHDFLRLRVLCAVAYLPIIAWARRPRSMEALVVVSAIAVLWVSAIICVMLTYTGYGDSLYYAGLIVTMLAAGLIMPWGWRTASVVGVGMAAMYLGVASLDSMVRWRAALNNTFFILGGLGISIAANAQRARLALAEFEGRHELAAALDKLRALDQMKTTFMANASHEMRTPLTLMLGALESLAESNRAARDAHEIEYLDVIRRNGLGLLRLINDLLDLARLEASQARVRLEVCDLTELLKSITTQAGPMAAWRGLTLRLDAPERPVLARLDASKVEKIVLNLVSNAIKFTPAGGSIRVRLEEHPAELRIAVTDSGIGIPASEHQRIFDRFSQVDPSATRSRGGTGIGLALVKELVELHGGRVAVSSEVGKGSTFDVSLPRDVSGIAAERLDRRHAERGASPARRAEDHGLGDWVRRVTEQPEYRVGELHDAADRRTVPRLEAPPRAATVLVVEDSVELLRFITLQLSAEYRVIAAGDGEEGLARAREHRPNLVITDWMMPGRDGPWLSRELRRDPDTRATPIVMLTARGQADDRTTARESGADIFLIKPFSVKELRAAVRSLLKRKEERVDELQRETGASMMLLTGGMAHEILNPLGFIANSLFALREVIEELLAATPDGGGTGPDSPAETCRRLLDASRTGVDRIRSVVEYLRAIARPGHEIAPELADLNQALTSTLLLTGALANPNVEVIQDLCADASVRCQIGRVNQVLLNLVKNALLAMPEGAGRLWVTTRRTADELEISIEDNGCGIPGAQIDRVFDPFFTTRSPGEGTGLGLALTRQIVEEHGGHVGLTSVEGEGTKVTVRLPIAGPPEAKAAASDTEVGEAAA